LPNRFRFRGAFSPSCRRASASRRGEARSLGAETVVSTESGLDGQVRGQWQDGIDACLDTIGLGADALACVRDGGNFVTSVPTAVPDAQRGIDTGTVQVQPDPAATADLAGCAVAGELTVRIAETLCLHPTVVWPFSDQGVAHAFTVRRSGDCFCSHSRTRPASDTRSRGFSTQENSRPSAILTRSTRITRRGGRNRGSHPRRSRPL
jgi:hypothetical protein